MNELHDRWKVAAWPLRLHCDLSSLQSEPINSLMKSPTPTSGTWPQSSQGMPPMIVQVVRSLTSSYNFKVSRSFFWSEKPCPHRRPGVHRIFAPSLSTQDVSRRSHELYITEIFESRHITMKEINSELKNKFQVSDELGYIEAFSYWPEINTCRFKVLEVHIRDGQWHDGSLLHANKKCWLLDKPESVILYFQVSSCRIHVLP